MAWGLAVRVGRERKSPGWSGNQVGMLGSWVARAGGGLGLEGREPASWNWNRGAANPLLCECGLGAHLRETGEWN